MCQRAAPQPPCRRQEGCQCVCLVLRNMKGCSQLPVSMVTASSSSSVCTAHFLSPLLFFIIFTFSSFLFFHYYVASLSLPVWETHSALCHNKHTQVLRCTSRYINKHIFIFMLAWLVALMKMCDICCTRHIFSCSFHELHVFIICLHVCRNGETSLTRKVHFNFYLWYDYICYCCC